MHNNFREQSCEYQVEYGEQYCCGCHEKEKVDGVPEQAVPCVSSL